MKSQFPKFISAMLAVFAVSVSAANAAWEFNEITLNEPAGREICSVSEKYISVGTLLIYGGKYHIDSSDVNIYDMRGKLVFTSARNFSHIKGSENMIFCVSDGGKIRYGICDSDYNILVPAQYDSIRAESSCDILIGNRDGIFYTFDKNGSASFLENGLIFVGSSSEGDDIVDFSGKSIFSEKYKSVYRSGSAYAVQADDGTIKILTAKDNHALIRLNGKFLDSDAVIRSGRTLVPMRSVIEALGGSVVWNGDTKTAVGSFGDTKIEFTANLDVFAVNGDTRALDVPAMIVNDRMMLPVRALAEALGANVDFNDIMKCVYIETEKQ